MQRAVLAQLARAGHICGAPVNVRLHASLNIRSDYCVLLPDHDDGCTNDLHAFPSSPLMRERVRRAKAVVQHESAERHVVALERRIARLEARRACAESYLGFRIEYRFRGGLRRLRRYWRFTTHRTVRRAWQAGRT